MWYYYFYINKRSAYLFHLIKYVTYRTQNLESQFSPLVHISTNVMYEAKLSHKTTLQDFYYIQKRPYKYCIQPIHHTDFNHLNVLERMMKILKSSLNG